MWPVSTQLLLEKINYAVIWILSTQRRNPTSNAAPRATGPLRPRFGPRCDGLRTLTLIQVIDARRPRASDSLAGIGCAGGGARCHVPALEASRPQGQVLGQAFSATELAARPTLVVLTKTDLAYDEDVERARAYFEEKTGREVFSISAPTGDGLEALKWALHKMIGETEAAEE